MLKQTCFTTENHLCNQFSFPLQQMKNMCMVTCIVENSIKMHRRRSHGSEYSRKTFPGVSCFCYYCHRSLRSILTKKPAKIEKWRLSLQNYELKIECRLQKPKKTTTSMQMFAFHNILWVLSWLNCSKEGGHI